MKKNTRKTFPQNVSGKTFYLVTFFALVAVAAMSFLMLPTNGTVSAQKANKEVATAKMIAISLNTRSAGNFAIFADKAVSDVGNSQIRGNVGVAGQDAKVSLDSASVEGSTYVSADDALRAQSDLAASFNAINQLPCVDVADSELGGKKFTPGVYCVSSARLTGEVTLDAQNDPSATFLFRVAGSFNAGVNSKIELANQASASNVVIVASDSARVGKGSSIKGSIYAENSVKADKGSTINGRILSLKGGVELDGASVVLADGTLEICKVVDPQSPGAAALTGRIFQFNVTGVARTIEAPANGCSGPFTVPNAGNVVITEANTSRAIGSSTLVPGNFQLVSVVQRNRQAGAANAVTGFNLPLRTANVTVPMGGVESQVTVEFTNQFAIVGFIEICKFANDSDVGNGNGFFDFIVGGLPQQGSNPPNPLQVITVPIGGCAGPIAVTVPSNGIGNPRSGTATVTELARIGTFFTGANTTPANRLLNVTIVNNTSIAGIVSATIFEAGDSSIQTRFNFFNSSNPAQVKICKVAGPGIPEGTLFNFTVTGLARVVDPEDGSSSAVAVTRTFNVQAGPAIQGGFCRFVPDATGAVTSAQTFLVGTNVIVTENGPLVNANGDEIRVGRITSTTGFVSPAIAGNVYFPSNGTIRTVTVPVRRQVVEVEYTNFVFRPGLLKICKIAGTGVAIGTPFTFDISTDLLQGTFPLAPRNATGSVTIQAGPASQGGYCALIGGVFSPTIQGVGVFNVGSTVTVTERVTAGVATTGIRTTSGGPLTDVSLAGRTGTVTILAGSTTGGVFNPSQTEIEFVNSQAAVVNPPSRATTAFDFDGDKKADISVFRDGNWYINRSELGFTAQQFGAKGDKIIPADYDGDGKADYAVYRAGAESGKGYFYTLNSKTGTFLPVQFGIISDVPVVGDYDGDGIADMAVYREGKNLGDQSFFYYRPSGTPGADFTTIQLGVKGDTPVVGDYDGDGKADAAVYRPSNGVWYIQRSRDGFTGVQFGISTDVPVAADYDGDGKTDLGVYRGGNWYLLQSRDGFKGLQFGIASDMPVPADIDGDGKDDIAVFRAGTWYWLNSGSNDKFEGMNFGIASDVPVFCPARNQ